MKVRFDRNRGMAAILLALITITAMGATTVERDWRGRETYLGAAPKATSIVPTSMTLTDSKDSSRYSNSKLQMVLSSGTTRTAKAVANPSGATGTWYVNGKQVGTGSTLTYNFPIGTHKVECKSGTKSVSATVEVVLEVKQTVKIELTTVKKLAEVLTKINQFLRQSDNKIQWTLQGSKSWWNVDEKSSWKYDVSKNLTLSGGAKLEYKVWIPGWSVNLTIPYINVGAKAGAFMEPKLSLLMEMSADKIASTNPDTWKYSGGPKLSGSIGGGLGIECGNPKVIKIEGDVRGTVAASGSGKLQGPPASVKLAYSIGTLTAQGTVKVWLVGKPTLNWTIKQKIWDGLKGETTVDLSSLIS